MHYNYFVLLFMIPVLRRHKLLGDSTYIRALLDFYASHPLHYDCCRTYKKSSEFKTKTISAGSPPLAVTLVLSCVRDGEAGVLLEIPS